MHQSVEDAFLGFNRPLEGELDFMYLDIMGLVSTGVGNLLDADDPSHPFSNPTPLSDVFALDWFHKDTHALAGPAEIRAEYDVVKFSGTAHASIATKRGITQLRITLDEIHHLVASKLRSFAATLRARAPFASFDEWPADAQLGLLSMAWAMGPLFSFPAFQAAAATRAWLTMSAECRMKETGNPGVIPRNVRDQVLFVIADWWLSPPPGEVTTLVYDPQLSLAENMRSGAFPVPVGLDIGVQATLERLSTALTRPDFDPKGLDGVFGGQTRSALVAYQSSRGLSLTPTASHVADLGQASTDALVADLDQQDIAHWP